MHKFLFYNKFIICLYMFRALFVHHQEVKNVLYSIWYHHTCRWPPGAQFERKNTLLLSVSVLKYSPCLESVCTRVFTVFFSLSYHCQCCHLCMHFMRRFSVYREHQPRVSLPSTCCFNKSQSALLMAKFSTMVISAVQGNGNTPARATNTRSSRPQILHNPFKCSGPHTSHVLPMEDVCRKLICLCLEQTFSWIRKPTSPGVGTDGRHGFVVS